MTGPLTDQQLAEFAHRTVREAMPDDGTTAWVHASKGVDVALAVTLPEILRLRAELADLRACPCFPNPSDHADRCPIFLAAAPSSEDDQW